MSFGIGGSSSSSTSLSQQTSIATSTAGASSPAASGTGSVIGAGKTLTGSNDNSGNTGIALSGAGNTYSANTTTTFGNGAIINPDSTALVQSALTTVGNALNTAIANRDVIAVGNATNPTTVTQTGTQTPTTGLATSLGDTIKGWLNSGGLKLALVVGFPVLMLLIWLIFRKKK